MTLKERLLSVAAEYARNRELSVSRVSTLVFRDGKVLDRLAGTADITTTRYEGAMAWFSQNWPEGLAWPDGIARPSMEPAE
ncbi:MAG: hypothetical protein ACT6QU_02040 [Aliihoeflea sp.]|uniref:hypothetical protein n=1 Tax=Aliihoeflea sp. TaxID=2608088 RepID=UPI0040349AA8